MLLGDKMTNQTETRTIRIYLMTDGEIVGRTLKLAEEEVHLQASPMYCGIASLFIACNLIGGTRILDGLCEKYHVDGLSLSANHDVDVYSGRTLKEILRSPKKASSVGKFINRVINRPCDVENVNLDVKLFGSSRLETAKLEHYASQIDSVITPWKYYANLTLEIQGRLESGMILPVGRTGDLVLDRKFEKNLMEGGNE
jgi:hypothetical protein